MMRTTNLPERLFREERRRVNAARTLFGLKVTRRWFLRPIAAAAAASASSSDDSSRGYATSCTTIAGNAALPTKAEATPSHVSSKKGTGPARAC